MELMLTRLLFSASMGWIAFVSAWRRWPIDMAFVRRDADKLAMEAIQERRFRVIDGGRAELPGKRLA